jgi:DNA invertase Pin-like site-specific DNA recombinase
MRNRSDVPVWIGGRWSGRFDDLPDAPQVLGYVRVAADDESRGRDSQIAAIEAECGKHGFELVGVVRETESFEDDEFLAQDGSGLTFALELVEQRLADGVVVANMHPVAVDNAEALPIEPRNRAA